MKWTYFLLLGFLALFVWFPGLPLPEMVATHFDASGHADGFMSRGGYRLFMSGLACIICVSTVGVPLWLISRNGIGNPPAGQPHGMVPERQAETVAFLKRWILRTGILVLALIGYVHWLVLRANQASPAILASDHLMVALLVFLLAMAGLIVQLLLRLRRGNRVGP